MAHAKAARRYANALFDLARDEGKLDIVAADLQALGRLMAASADLSGFLENYMIPLPRRIQILGLLFEGRLDPLTFRFLVFVDEKRRIHLLRQIIEEFKRYYDEHQGVLHVRVTTARKLSDDQAGSLAARLQKKFNKRIDMHTQLDASLLGGFRVQVGDRIHDYSIETQLQTLHQHLVNA
jgi:F-type H+-transporting ATPase subunit delta